MIVAQVITDPVELEHLYGLANKQEMDELFCDGLHCPPLEFVMEMLERKVAIVAAYGDDGPHAFAMVRRLDGGSEGLMYCKPAEQCFADGSVTAIGQRVMEECAGFWGEVNNPRYNALFQSLEPLVCVNGSRVVWR